MSKTNNIYQNKDPKAKFQIDRECRWFYEGTEIKRHAMVCLFSRYLKRDDNGAYNLVTPYECVAVGVELAGFKVYGGDNAPYVWIKVPEKMSSWDFFDYLLEKANVVGTPGSGFGLAGEGYFRLSAFN